MDARHYNFKYQCLTDYKNITKKNKTNNAQILKMNTSLFIDGQLQFGQVKIMQSLCWTILVIKS